MSKIIRGNLDVTQFKDVVRQGDTAVMLTWEGGVSPAFGALVVVGSQGGATTGGGSSAGGVNVQSGTSYTISLSSDNRQLITFSNASPVAVTLPQASAAMAFWSAALQNRGAGTVTITPTTSTIDGASSLALTTGQGVVLYSDGTNYYTERGMGGGGGGTGTVTHTGALTSGLPVIGNGSADVTVGTRTGNTTEFATSTGSLTQNVPLIYDASGNVVVSTRSGNTTEFATSTGSKPSGNLAVWDANGNAVDGGAPATGAGALILISKQTVAGSAAATITFSSIPGSYTSLLLLFTANCDYGGGGEDYMYVRFNGDASNVYLTEYGMFFSTTTVVNSVGATTDGVYLGNCPSNFSGPVVARVDIPNYAGTVWVKGLLVDFGYYFTPGFTNMRRGQIWGQWGNTGAITSMVIRLQNASNFNIGSMFALYGIV